MGRQQTPQDDSKKRRVEEEEMREEHILRHTSEVPLPPIPNTNYASFLLSVMANHGEKKALTKDAEVDVFPKTSNQWVQAVPLTSDCGVQTGETEEQEQAVDEITEEELAGAIQQMPPPPELEMWKQHISIPDHLEQEFLRRHAVDFIHAQRARQPPPSPPKKRPGRRRR